MEKQVPVGAGGSLEGWGLQKGVKDYVYGGPGKSQKENISLLKV